MRRLIVDLALPRQWREDSRTLAVTPNPRAARAVGAPRCTLQDLGRHVLSSRGWGVASALQAHPILRDVIQRHTAVRDADGAARAWTPAVQELLRAGWPLEEMEACASPHARLWIRTARLYRDELRRRTWVDSAEILQAATAFRPPKKRLCVYGYPRLGADELLFLDALADEGSEVILPSGDLPLFQENRRAVAFLEKHGWRVERRPESPETLGDRLANAFLHSEPAPDGLEAHRYPDQEAEVRGVLSQVKKLLHEGVHPSQIVLVAQDERLYGPLLLEVAHEYRVPVRALYQIPLSETRLGAWLRLALDSIQNGLPFESTVRLLGHPLGHDYPGLCFEEHWNTLRRTYPSGLEAWQTRQIDLSLLDWPPENTRAAYAECLQTVLDSIKIRNRCAYWARELIAFNALSDEQDRLPGDPDETVSRETFIHEIHELLGLLCVPVQPGRGGVELHTPFSLYGAAFDHVFVLGAAEGFLPAPIHDRPVFDFHDREHFARSGYDMDLSVDSSQREHLSFWNLLRSARKSLALSHPLLLENREVLPSVYFSALGLSPRPPRISVIPSEEELRIRSLRLPSADEDPVTARARRAWRVEQAREVSPEYDEFDGILNGPLAFASRTFSASQLLGLGQCPFRWFSGYALRLAEPDEAEMELSPQTKGSLFHTVLQRLADQTKAAPDPRQGMLDCLESTFAEIEAEMRLSSLPAWFAQRGELLSILRRAVQGADFLLDPARVLACEQPFDCDWNGFRIRGRIDRIDRGPDGLVVIDYKSGSTSPAKIKDEGGAARVDLQLPLYMHAAAALYPEETVQRGYYYSLKKAKTLLKARPDEAGLQSAARRMQSHFTLGRFPVDPDGARKACDYCPYVSLCRAGSRLCRKGDNQ